MCVHVCVFGWTCICGNDSLLLKGQDRETGCVKGWGGGLVRRGRVSRRPMSGASFVTGASV